MKVSKIIYYKGGSSQVYLLDTSYYLDSIIVQHFMIKLYKEINYGFFHLVRPLKKQESWFYNIKGKKHDSVDFHFWR